jgi:hypothetical protein
LRTGDRPTHRKPYVCKTYSLGYPPLQSLDKALAIAASLEEEEIARKLTLKK